MPSPFPGMNAYFEDPDFWPGVHHWLINEIARSLNRQLSDKYVVAVEVRMYETTRLMPSGCFAKTPKASTHQH